MCYFIISIRLYNTSVTHVRLTEIVSKVVCISLNRSTAQCNAIHPYVGPQLTPKSYYFLITWHRRSSGHLLSLTVICSWFRLNYQKSSETDIINMLEFLIDNIFVVFGGRVFQQTVGIPMGTNCAPLLANLFLYSYEADFEYSYRGVSRKDDVLSLNNFRFGELISRPVPL